MRECHGEVQRAVKAGYWTLYRYDPRRRAAGQNPFVVDSEEPTASFQDFIRGEVRFAGLLRQYPDSAETLLAQAEQDAKARRDVYRKLAES